MQANDPSSFDVRPEDRHLVAAWVRHKYRAGEVPFVAPHDAKNIVINAPKLEPGEKAQVLLRVMGERHPVSLTPLHEPVRDNWFWMDEQARLATLRLYPMHRDSLGWRAHARLRNGPQLGANLMERRRARDSFFGGV